MPTIGFPIPTSGMDNDELAEFIAKIVKELEWALSGNLDVKNIKAKSITADRMKVDELSAIAANLGTITAGIIYGAYIATANGTYPRIEFSSADNLLKALSDASHYISIDPEDSSFPTIRFTDPASDTVIFGGFNGDFVINTLNANTQVGAQAGHLTLVNGTGKFTKVKFNEFQNTVNGLTLRQELDAKRNTGGGFSGSFATGDGRTAFVTDGIITNVI